MTSDKLGLFRRNYTQRLARPLAATTAPIAPAIAYHLAPVGWVCFAEAIHHFPRATSADGNGLNHHDGLLRPAPGLARRRRGRQNTAHCPTGFPAAALRGLGPEGRSVPAGLTPGAGTALPPAAQAGNGTPQGRFPAASC